MSNLLLHEDKQSYANVGLFCECFPPVMDGVSVCMQNYARWIQQKVGGAYVVTPNVPGANYDKLEYKVLDYFSVPVPRRHPYVTGIADIDPSFLNRISKIRFTITKFLIINPRLQRFLINSILNKICKHIFNCSICVKNKI